MPGIISEPNSPMGEFFFASSDLESRLFIFVFQSGVKIVEACQSMLHVIAMTHYRIKVKKLKSLGCTLYIRLQAPALLRVSLFFVYFFSALKRCMQLARTSVRSTLNKTKKTSTKKKKRPFHALLFTVVASFLNS